MPQKIIVQEGDNLSTISERYAVPIRNIIEMNHLAAPYALQAGEPLTLLGAAYSHCSQRRRFV
ncbi:MAG: LysM peptidoglycan-binding domain-containing protein [Holosporaceae bacterium]|nr:MAG: LysM peptidoglycan-binding domain-containing protein [Holosporaceae bacterium]